MSQINVFNSGLNTRVHPTLLQSTESTICNNIDLTSGILQSAKGDTAQPDVITDNIFWFTKGNLWLSSILPRDYIEFQEKLYYSDGISIPQKSANGTLWQNLGILGPTTKPTITTRAAGSLNGTYQYCYTYYNNVDGTESMPSPYSITLATILGIDVSVTASTDTQVDKIRIYRLGGAITAMSLVAELGNTTQTYADTLADIAILGTILTSYNNGQAPNGLTNMTEANAMFFGSKGSTLYYSDIAYVNYWSPFNFIVFDDTITGIGSLQNGLLVFTKFKTYIVTGNSPDSLSKYLLNGSQGCLLHKSIQYASNSLIWLSSDGLCFSTGGDIKVVTRDKLNKLEVINPKASMVYDDVYYLAHAGGILALDTRFGLALSTYIVVPSSFAIKQDILYYSASSILYSFGTSQVDRQLEYKSPNFSDAATSTIKKYKQFYVSVAYGKFSIDLLIDGIVVGTYNVTTGFNTILAPTTDTQGYYVAFHITGVGAIREIEYKVEGRQNGR